MNGRTHKKGNKLSGWLNFNWWAPGLNFLNFFHRGGFSFFFLGTCSWVQINLCFENLPKTFVAWEPFLTMGKSWNRFISRYFVPKKKCTLVTAIIDIFTRLIPFGICAPYNIKGSLFGIHPFWGGIWSTY